MKIVLIQWFWWGAGWRKLGSQMASRKINTRDLKRLILFTIHLRHKRRDPQRGSRMLGWVLTLYSVMRLYFCVWWVSILWEWKEGRWVLDIGLLLLRPFLFPSHFSSSRPLCLGLSTLLASVFKHFLSLCIFRETSARPFGAIALEFCGLHPPVFDTLRLPCRNAILHVNLLAPCLRLLRTTQASLFGEWGFSWGRDRYQVSPILFSTSSNNQPYCPIQEVYWPNKDDSDEI